MAQAKAAQKQAVSTDAYKNQVAMKQSTGWDQSKNQELRDNMAGAYDSAYADAKKRMPFYGGASGHSLSEKQIEQAAIAAGNKARDSAIQKWQDYSGKFALSDAQKGFLTQTEQLQNQANALSGQQFANSDQDRAARDQMLARQEAGFGALNNVLGQYQDIAQNGSGLVQQQYAQSRDDALRNAMSLASMGGPGGALATSQAGQQFANIQPQLAQGAAMAGIQEKLGALGAQSNVANSMLGQQLGTANLLQNSELGYQGYGQNTMGFLQDQQNTLLDSDYRNRALSQEMSIAEMQAELQKRQQNIGLLGGIIGAAGSAGAAAVGGGK